MRAQTKIEVHLYFMLLDKKAQIFTEKANCLSKSSPGFFKNRE
jgi:hypothetical protein